MRPRAAAFSENHTKQVPGGHIMPFWLAEISTSTPQSSIIIGAQTRDAIASTTSSAG